MKLILATLEYPPQVGGVASFCAQLVKALPKSTVSVVTNHHHELLFRLFWPRWIKSIFTLRKILHQSQAQAILVAQVLPLGTAAACLSKFKGIPVHILVHGLDVLQPQLRWRKKIMLRWVLRSATSVIANSRYTASLVQQLGIGHEKISILPLGPHIQPSLLQTGDEHWLASLGIPADARVVFSAARLVKRKGIDQIIQILPNLRRQVEGDVYLVIAGRGPEEESLKQMAKTCQVQNKVIFTGQVSDQQLAQLFQRCDVFVLPTRPETDGDVEGFGIVFLEANVFGKPVVGGKTGGVPDAIVDGLNGYLVEPNNLNMLYKAVLKLLERSDIAGRLGQQGKKRVSEQFDWGKNVAILARHLKIVE